MERKSAGLASAQASEVAQEEAVRGKKDEVRRDRV
jgi:hypothetical protein